MWSWPIRSLGVSRTISRSAALRRCTRQINDRLGQSCDKRYAVIGIVQAAECIEADPLELIECREAQAGRGSKTLVAEATEYPPVLRAGQPVAVRDYRVH